MKNMKSTLMYLLNIILAVLTFVFLSQSYIAFDIAGRNLGNVTGYDIIGNYFEGNGTQVMMALSNLIVAIIAGLVILTSIYCLFATSGVIKKPKAFGLIKTITTLLSIASLVFAAISLFCTIGEISDLSQGDTGYKIGWAIIVNLVLSVILPISSFLGAKFSKK